MNASARNLQHALDGPCKDPDCEIHNPDVIEDQVQRDTACAWWLAGVHAALDLLDGVYDGSIPRDMTLQQLISMTASEAKDCLGQNPIVNDPA